MAQLEQQTADLAEAQQAAEQAIADLKAREAVVLQALDGLKAAKAADEEQIADLTQKLADAQANPPEAALVDQSIAGFRKIALDLQGIDAPLS